MKNIFSDKLGKFKSLKINLLDGQRRGEVVFRRVFLLTVLYIIIALIGKLITTKPEERFEVDEAEAVERIVWEGDQKIRYTEDGEKRYIYQDYVPSPEEAEEGVEVLGKGIVDDSVRKYIESYGGRINDEYLASLRNYCDEDTLKLVIAISVAETSMGKNTDNHSNFYGYFYGGDRSYDPSYDEMSMVICRGISKYYSDVATNRARAVKYVGGDVDMWMKNVNKVLSKI